MSESVKLISVFAQEVANMYSSIVRDDTYKKCLLDFIQCDYDIYVVDINVAKRGFYGETWKASAEKAHFFIKLVYCDEHKWIYEQSLPVIQHLCDHGIDFISRIVKTKEGKISTCFDGC